jgi:ribosome-binding protein aMBF1 (putative translation factor)
MMTSDVILKCRRCGKNMVGTWSHVVMDEAKGHTIEVCKECLKELEPARYERFYGPCNAPIS